MNTNRQIRNRAHQQKDSKRKSSFYRRSKDAKLYIMACGSYFKVGIAKDPRKRVVELQTGCPEQLFLIKVYSVRDAASLEAKVHEFLRRHNRRNEWFYISGFNNAIEFLESRKGVVCEYDFMPAEGGWLSDAMRSGTVGAFRERAYKTQPNRTPAYLRDELDM